MVLCSRNFGSGETYRVGVERVVLDLVSDNCIAFLTLVEI